MRKRISLRGILTATIASAGLIATSQLTIATVSTGQILWAQAQSRLNFQGRFLAVLSDADMEASAYI